MNTQIFKEDTTMEELATNTFNLNYTGFVKSVEVAPILQGEGEKENIVNVVDKEEIGPFDSCKEILYKNFSYGNGNYTISVNGEKIDVYCDMTTDGGGWTRFIRHSDPDGQTAISQEDWDNGIQLASDGGIKDWLIKTWGNPGYGSETGENYINAWVRELSNEYVGSGFEFFKYHDPTVVKKHRYGGKAYANQTRLLSNSKCVALKSTHSPSYIWGEYEWSNARCSPDECIGWMWIDYCGNPKNGQLLIINYDYDISNSPAIDYQTLIYDPYHSSGKWGQYDEDGGAYEFFYR
jgi:hypothetical protein